MTTENFNANEYEKGNDNENGYLIDTKQVAKRLSISVSMVKSLTSKNKLKPFKIGRSVRYRLTDINSYVETCANA